MPRRRAGYTLIEILVVVAIIGIITAISVVNYFNAIQRAKQKRTMADMRGISVAVDSYNIDFNMYPAAGGSPLPGGVALPTKTLQNVNFYVTPTYIQVMPLSDGWNSWYLYGTDANQKDFILESTGSDGIPDGSPPFGPTTDFRADIIFVDGAFVQYPEGVQGQ